MNMNCDTVSRSSVELVVMRPDALSTLKALRESALPVVTEKKSVKGSGPVVGDVSTVPTWAERGMFSGTENVWLHDVAEQINCADTPPPPPPPPPKPAMATNVQTTKTLCAFQD
jgi:hypothetical protein